eukprot:5116180-Pleurochrysis_carterae.AAC.1
MAEQEKIEEETTNTEICSQAATAEEQLPFDNAVEKDSTLPSVEAVADEIEDVLQAAGSTAEEEKVPAMQDVPSAGAATKEAATEEALPAATEEALPAATEEALPAATEEALPAAAAEALPAATEGALPAATEEALPAATEEALPSETEEALSAAEVGPTVVYTPAANAFDKHEQATDSCAVEAQAVPSPEPTHVELLHATVSFVTAAELVESTPRTQRSEDHADTDATPLQVPALPPVDTMSYEPYCLSSEESSPVLHTSSSCRLSALSLDQRLGSSRRSNESAEQSANSLSQADTSVRVASASGSQTGSAAAEVTPHSMETVAPACEDAQP